MSPEKSTSIKKDEIMKNNYFNTEVKENTNKRQLNFNSPQDLVHSNANHRFYSYFFNYSPALDPFSDNYYLKSQNGENHPNQNSRRPSPSSDIKLNYSNDNYLK